MTNLLLIIIVATAISIVLNVYLKRHHLPPVVGYIVSGFVISYLFGLSHSHESLLMVGEFGIVFLMFTIALEFSIAHLRSMKREVFLFGGLQVGITGAVIGFIAHYFFGIGLKSAVILGAALALSSTAIVLKILNENGEIARPYGRRALGVLLFQDLAVIPIFLMITLFSDQTKTLSELLIDTLIHAAITLSILFIVGRYVLNRFLTWVTAANSDEIFIASILLIVLSSSMLAHYFGFSYSLGAFVAGIMIAETKFRFQVESDLIPFRDILLGVFFVTVGMQINLHFLLTHLLEIVLLLGGIMLLKAFIIFGILKFFTTNIGALKTAITISQVGEFSFAVFEIARISQIFPETLSQMMLIVVVFSMILTPFIIRNIASLTDFMQKRNIIELEKSQSVDMMADHVIVCGYSRIGKHVVSQLKQYGIKYVAIDSLHQLVEGGIREGDNVIFGNAAQKRILHMAHLQTAASVIIAIDDEKKAQTISDAIISHADNMNIIVKIADKANFALLEGLPMENIINETELIAERMVEKALTCSVGKRNLG